ncbi:putative PHD type zinc finger protein with BAH domain-containing protein [Neocucurbitaria cava]|uniref:PHD type zinc finger protein with BAH domain-containing protein n=1 Tax=Neocucurbitaria cava TaxID=798079 RepID=A0A9W8YDE2_9PLEO|nr:putative PHD type zinc finger protein with BAH domain-containing protein [Neocucurbitaria cava]
MRSGYIFGFDMTPVKASRRDAVPTVTLNGETGTLAAAIWCKEHAPKIAVHSMNEPVEGSDQIALQLFAREFKQADLTLTGTARKANLVDQSTRIVSQPAPTQVNRRASAVTAQTPTSARGRPSIAGLPVKEESSEPPIPRPERKCVRCKIEASPRWWKVDETLPTQNAPRVVDGPLAPNGTEPNANGERKPNIENGQIVNGSTDHQMPDAPPVVSAPPQNHLRLDTDVAVVRSASYLCQKCHWKKQNGADDEEERSRSVSVVPEPQHLALRSPPVQPYAPPALAGPWAVPGAPLSMPPNQPPPLPAWHSSVPPPGPPSHHLLNGNGYPAPPPLQGPPVGHAAPYHAPYPQPNGYPPYTGPPIHSQMPPAPLRVSYPPPPVSGPPPPLHLNNGAMLVNGMQSPRTMPYSPTHPHAHHSSRSTESPFTAPARGPAVPSSPTR